MPRHAEHRPERRRRLRRGLGAAGGGDGAAHCRALSQIALGEPEVGAALLDKLAGASKAPPARAGRDLRPGRTGLDDGRRPARAYNSGQHGPSRSQPDEPDLLIDRAIAGSALERYRERPTTSTHALDADPRRVDALVLRAAAWRHSGKLDLAQDDIDRALPQDAENPDALLERGILRQRRGDQAGARRDWERAMAAVA